MKMLKSFYFGAIILAIFISVAIPKEKKNQNADQNRQAPPQHNTQTEADQNATEKYLKQFTPPDKGVKDLRQLLIDLAKHNSPAFMTGKIAPLSSPASAASSSSSSSGQESGETEAQTGSLWIYDCNATVPEKNRFGIVLKAKGWEWVQQETQKAHATFEVGQTICFDVKIAFSGYFELLYDPNTHIVNFYLVQTKPVQADFNVVGAVNVETKNLWSSIVGSAASMSGESLGQRAEQQIETIGTNTIQAKLDHGYTVIFDLCTTNVFTRFGTFPPGKLPVESKTKESNFEINTLAALHPKSMLMAGPFDANKPILAHFENVSGGSIQAWWFCQEKAKEIAWNYSPGKQVSLTGAVAEMKIEGNKAVDFHCKPQNCKMVLMMMPVGEQTANCRYIVSYPEKKQVPLIDCNQVTK